LYLNINQKNRETSGISVLQILRDSFKIEIHKKKWRNPLRHRPDYWLVDHIFIREYFAKASGDNFEKFKLELFLPYA
jgi:hypothetical protein